MVKSEETEQRQSQSAPAVAISYWFGLLGFPPKDAAASLDPDDSAAEQFPKYAQKCANMHI